MFTEKFTSLNISRKKRMLSIPLRNPPPERFTPTECGAGPHSGLDAHPAPAVTVARWRSAVPRTRAQNWTLCWTLQHRRGTALLKNTENDREGNGHRAKAEDGNNRFLSGQSRLGSRTTLRGCCWRRPARTPGGAGLGPSVFLSLLCLALSPGRPHSPTQSHLIKASISINGTEFLFK